MELRVKENIRKIIKNGIYKENEALSNYTTFCIGGNALIYTVPYSIYEFVELICYLRKENIDFFVMGKGSNILVSDRGYNGVVIQTKNALNSLSFGSNYIYANAGISLSKLCNRSVEHELSGLEFASGIPGTLGGAIVMNAGAYENEISDYIDLVDVLDKDNNIVAIKKNELNFGYRTSNIKEKEYIIIGAKLLLIPLDKNTIKQKMDNYNTKRKDTQPLEYPSAGSIFKRPDNNYAGKLIEECDLKGFQVGGAIVSNKHAGFIVNKSNAKASDVASLISIIQEKVYNKTGINLETEIEFLGEF